MQGAGAPRIPECQLYRVTCNKCRLNTVVPTDDGPKDAKNM